jgi:hypothetical protein
MASIESTAYPRLGKLPRRYWPLAKVTTGYTYYEHTPSTGEGNATESTAAPIMVAI